MRPPSGGASRATLLDGVIDHGRRKGPHYFVAFQTPGPKWVQGVRYNEQPDFFKSVGYMTGMADKGMTIFRAADVEEATRIATDDPTVKSSMLNVEVRMFWVPFHE